MDQTLYQELKADIRLFEEKLRAFEAGEIEKKTYKGFSGGFGSYAQRNGGNMLRLRMAGGAMDKEKLAFLADCVDRWSVRRLKLTTCQTVQLHDLSADATVAIMTEAMDHGIITRGGGGDFPRNVMVSPLSGVEQGEYFDVRPWADAMAEYLLGRVRELRMPRKLKVAFSNSPANATHATFRDLGFVAREDGGFAVYCAGGLGPNPKLGVCVRERIEPKDVLHCADAMIRVFTAHGNYENRARARTRYLQDTLGAEGLRQAFAEALAESKAQRDLSVFPAPQPVDKPADGAIEAGRVIPQKQPGLYAVSYHPLGGNLAPEKPAELLRVIRDLPDVSVRIGADGTLYVINLTAREVPAVLQVTDDGANTLFETSVCCIGASICQQGARDSQQLLAAMLDAARRENFADGVLPRAHISGCPSSCGTHQVGTLGFVGGVKTIDKVPHPAFTLMVGGIDAEGSEQFGRLAGVLLQEDIPQFIVELGRTVQAANSTFDEWYPAHTDVFNALVQKFVR